MKNLRKNLGSFKVVREESELQMDNYPWLVVHCQVWQQVLNKVWVICGLVKDNTKEN